MTYRAVVNLVPPIHELGLEVKRQTSKWHQTVVHSIDDALAILESPETSPASQLNVWVLNGFPVGDQDRIRTLDRPIQYMNLPDWQPWVQDIINVLPSARTEEGQIRRYPTRQPKEVRFLVIHHTVSWFEDMTVVRNAIRINNYHLASKGWPRIGYHYLIAPNGEIAQTNNVDVASYHAGSLRSPGDENRWGIGIALGGNFTTQPPSLPQLFAAQSLVKHLQYALPHYMAVIPHKWSPGAATVCPGDINLAGWFNMISGKDAMLDV